ncbi:hypothetical protein ACH492_11930 [Streptomyces sp. NPDC019443]|uniref:hypothetical protein n=1 Tax=Streptomyces sp. NPDC019443 TaxID=3365061 RepID=UPI0037902DF2
MRAIRVASLALMGTAALTVGAPAALAADEGDITPSGFTVTPSTVAPGGTVTLNAAECEVPTVTVSSGVFETVTLDEGHPGTVKIDAKAEPGAEDEVTFDCNGEKVTTALAISSGSGSLTGTGTETGDSPTGTEAETGDALTGTEAGDALTETEPGDVPTETETKAENGDSHTETEPKGETGQPPTKTEAETGQAPTRTEAETGDSHTKAEAGTGDSRTDSHTGTGTSHTGSDMRKPGAGVDAGAGGSFSDLSPAQIAVGSALVAGGVLGGGVLLLRRRSGEGV